MKTKNKLVIGICLSVGAAAMVLGGGNGARLAIGADKNGADKNGVDKNQIIVTGGVGLGGGIGKQIEGTGGAGNGPIQTLACHGSNGLNGGGSSDCTGGSSGGTIGHGSNGLNIEVTDLPGGGYVGNTGGIGLQDKGTGNGGNA